MKPSLCCLYGVVHVSTYETTVSAEQNTEREDSPPRRSQTAIRGCKEGAHSCSFDKGQREDSQHRSKWTSQDGLSNPSHLSRQTGDLCLESAPHPICPWNTLRSKNVYGNREATELLRVQRRYMSMLAEGDQNSKVFEVPGDSSTKGVWPLSLGGSAWAFLASNAAAIASVEVVWGIQPDCDLLRVQRNRQRTHISHIKRQTLFRRHSDLRIHAA